MFIHFQIFFSVEEVMAFGGISSHVFLVSNSNAMPVEHELGRQSTIVCNIKIISTFDSA